MFGPLLQGNYPLLVRPDPFERRDPRIDLHIETNAAVDAAMRGATCPHPPCRFNVASVVAPSLDTLKSVTTHHRHKSATVATDSVAFDGLEKTFKRSFAPEFKEYINRCSRPGTPYARPRQKDLAVFVEMFFSRICCHVG